MSPLASLSSARNAGTLSSYKPTAIKLAAETAWNHGLVGHIGTTLLGSGLIVAMMAAVVLVRTGRVLAMNAASAASARRRRLTCFAIATVLMLAAVPWPGLANGRPLIRGLVD